MKAQYDRLRMLSPRQQNPVLAAAGGDSPTCKALSKTMQKLEQLEIEYRPIWEQADALINLGDGRTEPVESRPEVSASGTITSKRQRCASLAPLSTKMLASTAEMEEGQVKREGRMRPRRSSASLAERQESMLRAVLSSPAPTSSFGSRGSSRSTLAKPTPAIGLSRPSSTSTTPVPPATLDRSTSQLRRVSMAGLSGVKGLLLKLKIRAAEEGGLARSASIKPNAVSYTRSKSSGFPAPLFSFPTAPASLDNASPPQPLHSIAAITSPASNGSTSDDEDWDKDLVPSPPRAALSTSLRRSSTQPCATTAKSLDGAFSKRMGEEKMILTTQSLPGLLVKVREVQTKCAECISRVRGLTL